MAKDESPRVGAVVLEWDNEGIIWIGIRKGAELTTLPITPLAARDIARELVETADAVERADSVNKPAKGKYRVQ